MAWFGKSRAQSLFRKCLLPASYAGWWSTCSRTGAPNVAGFLVRPGQRLGVPTTDFLTDAAQIGYQRGAVPVSG